MDAQLLDGVGTDRLEQADARLVVEGLRHRDQARLHQVRHHLQRVRLRRPRSRWSGEMTSSVTASRSAPPENTPSRRKTPAARRVRAGRRTRRCVLRSVCWRVGRSTPVSLSSSRSSSRASRALGVSSLVRAAASSIASGSPSSRRQTADHVGDVVVREREPRLDLAGPAARTAAPPRTAPRLHVRGARKLQRRHRMLVLGRHVQRTARRGDHDQPGAPGQQLGDHRVRTRQLLEVVQHEHGAAVGEVVEQPGRRTVRGRYVERLGDRRPHHLGRRGRGQRHEVDPVGEVGGQPLRQLDRQPGLARPTRTGQRDQPDARRTAAVPPSSASSPSRPTNGSAVAGRLDAAPRLRNGGKSRRRPSTASWNRCSGAGMSLSRCDPRSTQAHPVAAARAHERGGRLGHHHLPAVRGRGDPSGPVHVHADVAAVVSAGEPVWTTHPHPHRLTVRPRVRGQRPLRLRPPPARRPAAVANTTKKLSPSVPISRPCQRAHASRSTSAGRPAPRRTGRPAGPAAASTPRCRRTASSPSRTASRSQRPVSSGSLLRTRRHVVQAGMP